MKSNQFIVRNTAVIAYVMSSLLIYSLPLSAYTAEKILIYPDNVFWGDTHLHTNLSSDANILGNKKLFPSDAYRFARGDSVVANSKMTVKLRRPLDFLVIADHAENLGVMARAEVAEPNLLRLEKGKRLYELLSRPSTRSRLIDSVRPLMQSKIPDIELETSVWASVTATADQFYSPGKFTTFIGYEWTGSSYTDAVGNFHRVVIFKDDANKANKILPFSALDDSDPEGLWRFMKNYQESTGGEVLAIPHGPNVSNGTAFHLTDKQMNRGYVAMRSRWEPLVEITQIKGDSETHPILSPIDEFADYETWNSMQYGKDLGFIRIKQQDGSYLQGSEIEWSDEVKEQKKYEYVRSGLKSGLTHQFNVGANPFKFGLIGSTDSHTSLSTADEKNFWGKTSRTELNPERLVSKGPFLKMPGWQMSAAGYAAVWAQENTREALFAAMKRKEVYASTGPRITVRFFGGWEYEADDAFKPNLAQIGYEKGVPMGGDLSNSPEDKAPSFLIRAVRDPDGANLDRVQVIKGWRSTNGELHEKVHNVALSDNRKPNWRGKVKPVGNTVDIADASYINSVGDPELSVVWVDPDFSKDELAFYYVRVLEIPTPRWTAYDAKFFGLKDVPGEIPMVTQERAYSSPIWYTPVES